MNKNFIFQNPNGEDKTPKLPPEKIPFESPDRERVRREDDAGKKGRGFPERESPRPAIPPSEPWPEPDRPPKNHDSK